MSEHECLLREDEGEVRTLRIMRPAAMNALNRELLSAFSREFQEIKNEPKVRALIVTAEGERAFCAGADLKERRDMSIEQTKEFVAAIGDTFRQLEKVEIPTIAAMNGSAFGGGLELALACDFRLAVSTAKMGLTECRLGIIPGAGGTQRLPRLVGMAKAKRMILIGAVVDAAEALEMDLIDEVAEDATNLIARVNALVDDIKKCAPLSVKASKRSIQLGCNLEIDDGLRVELECYESLIHSRDRVEGLRAFAEKRAPKFTGC